MKSLDEINEIEQAFSRSKLPSSTITGGLMPAITAYEERYTLGENDKETVLRLLFLYWYALVEPPYITGLDDVCEPAVRFVTLFEESESKYQGDFEFSLIVGYLLSLAPFLFGDQEKWEDKSSELLARAAHLEPTNPIIDAVKRDIHPASEAFLKAFSDKSIQSLFKDRFSNRGYMGVYLIESLSSQ
jgi:hypothetical protein